MNGQLSAASGDRSPKGSPWKPAMRHDSVWDPDDTAMQLRLMLNRLDMLGWQMEGMSSGQKVLEAVVNEIHTDIVQLPARLGKHVSMNCAPAPVDRCSAENAGQHLDSLLAQSSARHHSDDANDKEHEVQMRLKLRTRPELHAHRCKSEGRISLTATPAFFFSRSKSESSFSHHSCFQPLHPECWRRAIFDVTTMIMLLYESIWIPYQLAWNIKLEGAVLVLSFLAAGFWTFDLLLGFGTGYRDKNEDLVMTFRGIAYHYLRTTFWANLIVVVVDITSIALELNSSSQSGATSSTAVAIKFARVIKVNRLLRLEAMFKTGRVALLSAYVVTYMRKVGLDEQFNFAVRIMTLILWILWVNHFGCCIWHSVGTAANEQYMKDYPGTADWPYLIGYLWSTSAIIAGEAIIMPTTAVELLVTTAFVLFGFIFSSILISWLISEVMDYGIANRERTLNLKILRQFLCQHTVASRLSMPIEKQANTRMASVRRLSEKDVTALSLISPTLRVELWAAMYGPGVSTHAFIRTTNILVPKFIRDLCFCAISHEAQESGRVIFEANIEAVGARIVYWGSLDYHPIFTQVQRSQTVEWVGEHNHLYSDSSVSTSTPAIQVVKGDWISEVALWAHWQHLGWMEASTPCELLTLRADDFLQVIASYPDALGHIADAYSCALLKATEEESQMELVNDLHLPVQHESIVSAMPLQARVDMSYAALQVLDRQNHWNFRLAKNALEDLQREIDTGECDMYVDEKENVQRVVTIVALRLEKQDSSIVAQIGKCHRGESSARCTLPGTKIKVGELPRDAVDRLVNSKLRPYKDGLVWGKIEVDQEERISKKFGLKSMYQRTVFHAKLRPDFVPVENTLPKKEQEMAEIQMLRREASIQRIVQSDQRAFTLGNMQTIDSTFIFAWLAPDDHFLLQNGDESDRILKGWISEVDLSEVEELSKSVSDNS